MIDPEVLPEDIDGVFGLEAVIDKLEPPYSVTEVLKSIDSQDSISKSALESLSRPTMETLQVLVLLWSKMPVERTREIIEKMVQMKASDRILDYQAIFLSAIRINDIPTRIFSIRGLKDEDRPEIMHLFLARLKEEISPVVRSELTGALAPWVVAAELGVLSTEDGEVLITALRELVEDIEEETDVRSGALESLGALSGDLISELITDQYETGGNQMQLAALRAMGRSASPTWLDLLIYHFDDDDPDIREVVAEAAGGLVTDGALEPLTMLLEEDPEINVRRAAIRALAEIGSLDAERILERIARDGREPELVDDLEAALDSLQIDSGGLFESISSDDE